MFKSLVGKILKETVFAKEENINIAEERGSGYQLRSSMQFAS